FAFGSNMSSRRLRARVASARFVATARLACHRLCFHKRGPDGSGKGDAEWTKNPADQVFGVVFELDATDKPILDSYEGLGAGYEEKLVELTTADGARLAALLYYATDIDAALSPHDWYLDHVLAGAREFHLPQDYINRIAATPTQRDPDAERARRERAIYQ